MLSFMFGVLGNVIFWLFYIAISLFIGTFILKTKAKEAWRFVKTGKSHFWGKAGPDFFFLTLLLLGIYLFWPIIVLILLLTFILKLILLKGLRKLITTIGDSIPEIEIKQKNKD